MQPGQFPHEADSETEVSTQLRKSLEGLGCEMSAPNSPNNRRIECEWAKHHYSLLTNFQPSPAPGMGWGCWVFCFLFFVFCFCYSGSGHYSAQGNAGKEKGKNKKAFPRLLTFMGLCFLPIWAGVLTLLRILTIFFFTDLSEFLH